MDNINIIIEALKAAGVTEYIVRRERVKSIELFEIGKKRDMSRAKDVTNYTATVYRDFDSEGAKMRGSANAVIFADMSTEEIHKTIADAWYAAQYVKNPWYELPEPVVQSAVGDNVDLTEAARTLENGLKSADNDDTAFINSAEIFCEFTDERIVSSKGADLEFTYATYKGEMIAQCVSPNDIELYGDFEFDKPDGDELKRLANELIRNARDRSIASAPPQAGNYTVILSGKHLATVMSAYVDKASASMIYSKYSGYSIGQNVQGDNISGEKINMRLFSKIPYSREGVPMPDMELISSGVLKNIYGTTRFCRYLGIEPSGNYYSCKLDNGSMSLVDMKAKPYLYPVAFSDFQMDSYTGRFGGEVRLAYLFDGETTRVLTGGSISGSLFEAQSDIAFSYEKYESANYSGPFAMLIKGVSVAGA